MKQRWPAYLAGFILGLACWAAYSRSLTVPFFFDDHPGIIDNESIRHLDEWAKVFWAPPEAAGATGRPLVNASLALNYAFGATAVTGYHLFNLAGHVLASLLLFGVIRRTLAAFPSYDVAGAAMPRSLLAAFGSALIWSVHPLLTESVICTIQRDELMVGACFLGSLYCFIRGWPAASVLLCFLGAACKEVIVGLPVVILAYDRTFVSGSFSAAWRTRKGYYLALLSSWLVLAILVAATRHRGDSAGFGLGVSSGAYLVTQARALGLYLKLCFWPTPLVVDYGPGIAALPEVLPQGLLILLLLAVTAVTFFGRAPLGRSLGFLGLWFFVILAPSSSIVPLVTQTIAEHRMYLPLAAVVALVVIPAVGWVRPARLVWVGVGCVVVAAVASAATLRRSAVYQDEFGLWQQTARDWPSNPRVFLNLGTVASWRGDQAAAIGYLRHSIALDPRAADTHFNLAVALDKSGRPAEAEEEFRRSLVANSQLPSFHYHFGQFLMKRERYGEAIEQFEKSLALRPNSGRSREALAAAQLGEANSLAKGGHVAESLPHFEAALVLKPSYPEALNNYANALAESGRHAEAVTRLREAIGLRPNYGEAHFNLAAELADSGDLAGARRELLEVIRISPDDRAARDELARMDAASR